jgi:crossover junction endodeoxyribonuclease RusA
MMRVVIPIKTVSEANVRGHWAKGARRAKRQRRVAADCVHLARLTGAVVPPLPLTVTLTRVAPRRLDSDNLQRALKAIRDGIADALGVDDGDARIDWKYDQRPGKPQRVEVTIK